MDTILKQKEINYDSARGGVSVITEKGDITTSYLLIQRARISDSGKYTCSPTHANPKTVNVHVLNGKQNIYICNKGYYAQIRDIALKYLFSYYIKLSGEEPAAIQRGSLTCATFNLPILAVTLLLASHKVWQR